MFHISVCLFSFSHSVCRGRRVEENRQVVAPRVLCLQLEEDRLSHSCWGWRRGRRRDEFRPRPRRGKNQSSTFSASGDRKELWKGSLRFIRPAPFTHVTRGRVFCECGWIAGYVLLTKISKRVVWEKRDLSRWHGGVLICIAPSSKWILFQPFFNRSTFAAAPSRPLFRISTSRRRRQVDIRRHQDVERNCASTGPAT